MRVAGKVYLCEGNADSITIKRAEDGRYRVIIVRAQGRSDGAKNVVPLFKRGQSPQKGRKS